MIKTAMFTLPTLCPTNNNLKIQGESRPADMQCCLAAGYHIVLMNDFPYEGCIFTHYVLEKEEEPINPEYPVEAWRE